MRQTTLPISLLNETAKNARVHILDTEPYDSVFGAKKRRKKPNFKVILQSLCNSVFIRTFKYDIVILCFFLGC